MIRYLIIMKLPPVEALMKLPPVEALMKLLDIKSSNVRFVGIYGMGGIGKTTLVKIVFNKLCDRFDGCSLLANVRESSKQQKGIERLQKQLLSNLVHESEDIMDVDDGMKRLREKLGRKNVPIVLDDIDSKEQIHNLARDASWFGLGSRIIITTRNQSILEIRRLGIQTLEVEELKAEEASRLFCMHAFQKDSPSNDYLSLSEEAIRSTGTLPLALAVIGAFLGDKPREKWTNIIGRLKKVSHEDVQKQLMISYEALSHETKQIFLDIGCFFIGHEKAYLIYMWQACDFNPERGLKELINLSLVKVIVDEDGYPKDVKKKFWMHDQLRILARNIVKSRIWMHDAALEMLQEDEVEAKENVEMIRLHYHDNPTKGYTFNKGDLTRFEKLRYFECDSGECDDSRYLGYEYDSWESMIPAKLRGLSWHKCPPILPKLRWLSWPHFPPKFMGVEFFLRKLVILNLSKSIIDENWRGWKQFRVGSPLKVLDLSGCNRLKRTPDLSVFFSLERLILAGCSSLVKIDPSIGVMKSLVEMDLSHADVAELSDTIGELVKLEVLSLRRCQNLKKLPVSIGNMRSLMKLDLSESGIIELPDSIGNMRLLVMLDLSVSGITEQPDSIGVLENLRLMDVTQTKIREFPSSFGMLKRLEELCAMSIPLEVIHSNTFEGLNCLRVLKLEETHLHVLPPKLPTGLTKLEISSSKILERVPELSNLQNLVRLVLREGVDREGSRLVHPIKLKGVGNLRRLVAFELNMWNVTCIPEEELFSFLP